MRISDWSSDVFSSDLPGHDVAGVDIEDHVELEPGPLVWAAELGDVPGPHLVRSGGHQLGLDRGGSAGLTASFPNLVLSPKEPVHGADRAQVGAFIEERRPALRWGLVAEPLAVDRVAARGRVVGFKGTVGSGSGLGWAVQVVSGSCRGGGCKGVGDWVV